MKLIIARWIVCIWIFVLTHPSYSIAPDLLYSISESSYVDIDSIRSAYNRLAENVRKYYNRENCLERDRGTRT